MQIIQGLRRAAQLFQGKPSTVFGQRRRTWGETCERVARLAAGLAALGAQPGDRVALLGGNSDAYVEAAYAVLWSGCVLVPCNARWSAAEHDHALRDCEPALIIVEQGLLNTLRGAPGYSTARTIVLGGEPEGGAHAAEALIAVHAPMADRSTHGDALACLMYTGGTTGRPKGVMLSHANIVTSYMASAIAAPYPTDCVALHVAPLFHLAALSYAFQQTTLGSTQVILPGFDPAAIAAAIVTEKVSAALLVPTMIDLLERHLQAHPVDMGGLQHLVYGAAPISEALLRRALRTFPNARFYQGYGQTELAGGAVMLGAQFHVTDGPHARLLRAAGRPNPATDIRIVDADMNEAPRGQVGEVAARGPCVMLGYWNMPALTAQTIVDGWLRTGDAGYMDEEGFLFLVDRLKDMIVSGGENVFSAEVENALAQHPAVLECAVIGIPDERWGEAVHAIVRLKEGVAADEAELTGHCGTLIADYKKPRSYTFREEPLPLSAPGKVLKAELRKAYWAGRERRVG